ncbi:GNAT family N-acetyltransferase [Ilumatobacter sp.]|uniref:GNAT family N-acetyltransferase n=1 Tax=Ilumatobacter sp. TaxID=1967498 RepID=UPI003B52BA4C
MSLRIVAIAHPSLVDLVDPFVDSIRRERRSFGRSATIKPFPSLVRDVADPARTRFGTVDGGRLVAMASMAADGDLAMIVDADRRGEGIGTAMMTRAIEAATVAGIGRLRMRSSHRSRPVAALAESHGWTVVDMGRGRIELFLDVARRGVG